MHLPLSQTDIPRGAAAGDPCKELSAKCSEMENGGFSRLSTNLAQFSVSFPPLNQLGQPISAQRFSLPSPVPR